MTALHVGFTGTQVGMTPRQHLLLRAELYKLDADHRAAFPWFHHGLCVGADDESHGIVRAHSGAWSIWGHPPSNPAKRAEWRLSSCDRLSPEGPYLVRNHAIVDACSFLIAAPKGMEEERRSGTWATVRYARKKGVPVVILWPTQPQEAAV